MRSIGVAQKALDTLIHRVTDPSRKTFGKYLYEHGLLRLIYYPLLSTYLMTVVQVLWSRILQNQGQKLRVPVS